MPINLAYVSDDDFEQWLDSQDMSPAPDVGHVTTSPAMTTAAPSASAVGIANGAQQSIMNPQLSQQLDELAQTFSVNPQLNGFASLTSPFPTFPPGFSPGMNGLRKRSSSSETKMDWSAVLKPVTSPVKGQLTASTTMSAAPTKPSRSSRKKITPNVGQW